MQDMDDLFFRHPREAGFTYGQHALRSLMIAGAFAVCSFKAVVHAVVPALFPTSSTDAVETGLPALMLVTADPDFFSPRASGARK